MLQVIKAKHHELDQMNDTMGMMDSYTNVGMVIEGGALAVCLRPELQDDFMALCKECRALVCCRVSPMQKAQVSRVEVDACRGVCVFMLLQSHPYCACDGAFK